jgi:DNA-binding transcriptional ArsR family regulator
MLRIHFTSEDIARTRIAPGPDPLWELVLAVHMLRPQPGDLLFAGWRRATIDVLRRASLGRRLRLLLALSPPIGYFPDFLTPIEAIRGLDSGLEAIRRTPVPMLTRDIRQLARSRRLPQSVRHVANGEPHALAELTDTMRTLHTLAITPYQRAIDSTLDRDRRIRMHAFADAGVEGLFGSLRPILHWTAGELRIPGHRDQELSLDGRGLLLIPSYFCIGGPLTMFDPSLPPVLIYPVPRQPRLLLEHPPSAALGALIGTTRAAVLDAIGIRRASTTDLARQVGIATASASEHATVLRQTGLITSHRERNRMLHQLTALGLALLNP